MASYINWLRLIVWSFTIVLGFWQTTPWIEQYYLLQILHSLQPNTTYSTISAPNGTLLINNQATVERILAILDSAEAWQAKTPTRARLKAQGELARGATWSAAQIIAQLRVHYPMDVLVAWDTALVYEQIYLRASDDFTRINVQRSAQQAWRDAGFDVPRFIIRGKQDFKNQQYANALLWFSRALDWDESSAETWYQLGLAYWGLDQRSKALISFQEAQLRGGHGRNLWYWLGLLQSKPETIQKSQVALQTALLYSDGTIGDSTLYFWLGYGKQFMLIPPDWDGAWSAYERVLKYNSYGTNEFGSQIWLKAETHFLRGQWLTAHQQWTQAAAEYQTTLALNPNYYEAYMQLAEVLERADQREAAKNILQTAITLQPKYVNFYLKLAFLYAVEQNHTEARSMYVRVLELDPGNQQAQAALKTLP